MFQSRFANSIFAGPREGAHNVLQIRALMASNEWEDKWLDLVLPALTGAA